MARTNLRRPAPIADLSDDQQDPDVPLAQEPLLNDQAPPTPDEGEDANDEDEIRRVFGGNDLSGGYIRILRRPPGEIEFVYCDKIRTGSFDIEHLKKLYGGGTYRLTAFNARGKYVTRKELSIDERIKGELDEKLRQRPESQGATVRETINLAKELQLPPPAPAAPPREDNTMIMTLLIKSMEAQAAAQAQSTQVMIAALTANQRQAAPASHGMELKDLLPLITIMLQRPEGAKPPSVMELVTALKGIKELTEGDDEPKGVMDNITEMLPALMGGMAMMRGQPAPAPAAPPPPIRAQVLPPRPKAAVPAPVPELEDGEEEELGEDEESPVQKPQGMADIVIDAARRNAKPEFYAEMVVDMTPAPQVAIVKSVLTGEAWFAQLFGGYPDAAQLRPWLEQLRTHVLDAFNRPPAEVPPPVPGAGDPARVPGAGDPEKAG